ncbi:cache domain-containing protein [Malaciobacter halophilus]|uniref:cache domain-containing protein n=1 Tax=Malaciobacter halophilus TaxID=197482 RepID=UPI0013FD6875|nr:cache domain-containing protein [Malaciobacter halophilus]
MNLEILQGMIRDQQTNTIKSASKRISKWLDQKIDSMNVIKTFIKGLDHEEHPEYIENLLLQSKEVANFANVYVGYEDDVILSGLKWNRPTNYDTIRRPWYIKTTNRNRTTITDPYYDVGFKKVVVAICTPFLEKKKRQGVVCGILPLNHIRNEILDISLPYDGIAYLIDGYGKILLHPREHMQLKNSPYGLLAKRKSTTVNNELDDYIFSHDHIDQSNWFIIAQLDKSSVYKKVNLQLIINLTIYGLSLVLFIVLNILYTKKQNLSDEKLKKTETLLNHFIEYGDRGVLIADSKSKILFFNSIFTKFLELSKSDIEDTYLEASNNIFKTFNFNVYTKIYKKIAHAKHFKESQECSFEHRCEEGEICYFQITVLPVFSSDKVYQGLMIFLQDVTAKEKEKIYKKEQEDILFQQAKMADLGEMIAAVSHQWRQPLNSLSIMVGNLLQFKQMNQLTDDMFEENLNHCITNIHYLADTIETFRNFYKPSKKWQEFEVDKAIDEVFYIISPHFKTLGIKLDIIKDMKDNMTCLNYKNEFQQIVANLIHNAKDAIIEDKKYSKVIEVDIELLDNKFYIKFRDYGCGINKKIEKKLFQSFATTKDEKGTGKGLYLSKLIAKNKLRGDLLVTNYKEPTEFLIILPTQKGNENA